jgi:hypothetical protein
MTRQDNGKDLLALWQDAVRDTDDHMRELTAGTGPCAGGRINLWRGGRSTWISGAP